MRPRIIVRSAEHLGECHTVLSLASLVNAALSVCSTGLTLLLQCTFSLLQRSWLRRFLTFMLLMFLLHSMGIGMFRVIASLCRDETVSSTGGSFFFLALLLLGGFLLARRASCHYPSARPPLQSLT